MKLKMLQSPLAIQIISGIITAILYFLAFSFEYKIDDVKEATKRKNLKKIDRLMCISAVISTCYFFYTLIIASVSMHSGFINCIKGVILIIVIIEIFLYKENSLNDFEAQAMFIILGVFAVLGIIGIGSLINSEIQENKYEKNIIQIEEPKTIEQKYELAPLYKEDESSSPYFRITINEEKKVYEFYYIVNDTTGEMYQEILDVENTGIVPLNDEEKNPYLYIKRELKYSINNNEDPPVEVDQRIISIKYELHLPEEDIKKVVQTAK